MKHLPIGLLAALVGVIALPASVAAGSSPVTFNVFMGDNCVGGTAAGNASVHLVWTDDTNNLKADKIVVSSPSGGWEFCSHKAGVVVETSDVLNASDGTSSGNYTVPLLTLFQNRDTNVYKGFGPAGEYVKLICGLSNGFEPCVQTWKLKVNSDGKWSYKPGWDVNGDEHMGVTFKDADGNRVNVWNTSPFVTVTIGQAAFTGAGRAGSPATVVLMKSNLDLRGMAQPTAAIGYGTFTSRFRDTNGHKVTVHVGDRVTSDQASDIDFVVSNITATVHLNTGHVKGACVPNSLWFMTVVRNGEEVAYDDWRFQDENEFNADFSDLPLMAGDRLHVSCQLFTGDRIDKWFTA